MSRVAIHVGLPKCASTYLQQVVFSNHPGIHYLGPENGVESVDRLSWRIERRNNFDPTDGEIVEAQAKIPELLDPGKVNVLSNEGYCRPPHHHHVDEGRAAEVWRQKAEWLKLCFGPAKVFFVVRQPLSLVESIYLQFGKGFQDKVEYVPFGRWLREDFARPVERRFLATLMWDRMVGHFEEVFGADQVKLLRFEDFVGDKGQFYGQLREFLELTEPIDPSGFADKIVNRRVSRLEMAANRMDAFLPKGVVPFVRRVLPSWLKRGVRRSLDKPFKVEMTTEEQAMIMDWFRENNPVRGGLYLDA